ncbi:MAG: hypothetical protein MRY83_02010, partial [Flavobacteriales bacterium]|nr:hypothetical protein [Flavobacteriales bacterium]
MNPSKSEDVAAIPGAIAHTIITAKVNFEYFISKKTSISSDEGSKHGIHPIIRLAVISITLGLATMILSVSIVTGFQNEIKSKVLGFASHVQITSLNLNLGLENNPISIEQDFYPNLKDDPAIRNIQVFAHKPGIIKTKKLV